MEKLVFEVIRPKTAERETQVMRVSKDFYNLVYEVSANTGITAAKVSERIAEYLDGKIFIEEKEI